MNMLARMLGAARLDPHTYEEVEADSGAMPQALLLVVVISLLSGVGEFFGGKGEVLQALIYAVVRGILFWAIWAFLIYMVGGTILRTSETHANWGQVARGTAFAQTPGVLNVLTFVSHIGVFILVGVWLWQFVGVVISARQTLDYNSAMRAFFVALITVIPSWILFWIVYGVIRGAGLLATGS